MTQVHEVRLAYTPPKGKKGPILTSSRETYAVLSTLYPEESIQHYEQFVVLFLNRRNEVLGYKVISQGGLAATVVDARIVFQAAILSNASSIILSHNHPSGNLQPSGSDVEITKNLKAAGELLEIKVLDHVIVTSDGYFSFADEGKL